MNAWERSPHPNYECNFFYLTLHKKVVYQYKMNFCYPHRDVKTSGLAGFTDINQAVFTKCRCTPLARFLVFTYVVLINFSLRHYLYQPNFHISISQILIMSLFETTITICRCFCSTANPVNCVLRALCRSLLLF